MRTAALFIGVGVLFGSTAQAQVFDETDAARIVSVAEAKYTQAVSELPVTQSPWSTKPDGTWNTASNTYLLGWTQGFFPGAMWLLHQGNGSATWRTRADAWTRPLENQKTSTASHDLGFKFMTSYGRAYELTDDPYYRDVLLTAANSLSTRYDPTAKIIICCDWNPDWQKPLANDSMMELELLLWAADHGGSANLRTIAINHAVTTMNEMIRPDGSTFHIVDFYAGTGTVRWKGTYQGYSDSSTWTRGQGWTIYGFVVMYRYTHDARFLTAARRTADYYLSRISGDLVPNWDLDAPTLYKDTSSAAIIASALLELYRYVPEATDQARYRNAALQMLESLGSPTYLNSATSAMRSVLAHAVGDLPHNKDIDVGLIYGDYYLLEAVNRFKELTTAAPIRFGSTWRYDDRGVDLGGGWTSPTYVDSSWRSGPAQLGYGDGDEATRLTHLYPSQPSVYFRQKVTISGPVTQASVRTLHDDGILVWVNGTQVYSRNAANGSAYSAWASGSGENTIGTATLPTSPFVEGENTIAAMVKQVSGDSSDTSFDLGLVVSTRGGTPPPPPTATVTVTSPNGGESWTVGSAQLIHWSTTGTVANVKLELSVDGGASWTTVIASTPNDGTYEWTVPNSPTTSGRVRASDAGNPAISDVSDASFTIAPSGGTTTVQLPFGSVWRYNATNLDPGPTWNSPSYNDASWGIGNAQLGYGDGDEATVLPRTSPLQPTVYFRRHLNLTGPVTAATLRTLQDDGLAVWVNGTLVFSKYIGSYAHSAYASAVSSDNELTTTAIPGTPFHAGDNVIAVMLKQHSSSSDLSFDLALTLTVSGEEPPPTEEQSTPIPLGSAWRYDASGVDRGSAWLAAGYDDSAWASGPAQLGYGDGDEATVIPHLYPAPPSFYFRKKINLTGTVIRADLKAIYDDAVAVWINGTLVFSRNMGNGTSFSAWASGSGENTVATSPLTLSPNPFVSGENTVCVMVKQQSSGSSDVSFALELNVTTRR